MLHDPHHRARAYPYELRTCSFVMEDGEAREVPRPAPFPVTEGRRPVLAVGSNMSPQQLARKFPPPDGGSIPVSRVRLRGFDTVYSTHFTSYGSIPATLHPSPGTTVTLFVTWLDPAQEERMHETEIASENYCFARLEGIDMACEHHGLMDHVYFYLSSRGALPGPDGETPVPLAGVPAEGRTWTAMHQEEVQDYARSRLAPHMDLHAFIEQNIGDPAARRERTARLHAEARPFRWPHVTRIEV